MLKHFHLQSKRTNLKKPNSERTGHGLRVRFNPLALLLDASLEGEFDLVQRIIYEVRRTPVSAAGSSKSWHSHTLCPRWKTLASPTMKGSPPYTTLSALATITSSSFCWTLVSM